MDNYLVFDDKAKRRMGIICFLPLLTFLATLGYYIYLLMPLASGHIEPAQVVEVTNMNYSTLLVMFVIMALVSTSVLIYCIVTIARVTNMTSLEKLKWVLILCIFVPITTMLFWIFVIRDEPEYVGRYPDIA